MGEGGGREGVNLCTITDIVFWGTAMDVRSCFFPTQHSLLTSVLFMTIHDTLLIACGQRTFFVLSQTQWSNVS